MEPQPADTDQPSRHRGRSIAATVLGILAVLVLSVTIIAVWAKATVLRSDTVGRLAGDALAQEEVQAGIAMYLSDQIAASVDLDTRDSRTSCPRASIGSRR